MKPNTTTFREAYDTPSTRVLQVTPGRCIAQSGRGTLQDMESNSIYDEDF